VVDPVGAFTADFTRRFPGTSTVVHYSSDVRLFLHWWQRPPADVQRTDIDRFIAWQQALGRARATINRRLVALRMWFEVQAEQANAPAAAPPRNPVHPRRHYLRPAEALPRDLTDEQIERLLTTVTALRNRALLFLMLRAGLRVGEVRSLEVSHCLFAQHARQRSRLKVLGKGRRERMVYLAADAEGALLDWLSARADVPHAFVFTNRFGAPITVTGIQLQITAYGRRAGLRLTCHQLRHTFARQLIEVGTPVTTVQRLLGHGSLRSTQRYLSLADPIVRRDYDTAMTRLLGTPTAERDA
jgi:site-specific recombinase XerD